MGVAPFMTARRFPFALAELVSIVRSNAGWQFCAHNPPRSGCWPTTSDSEKKAEAVETTVTGTTKCIDENRMKTLRNSFQRIFRTTLPPFVVLLTVLLWLAPGEQCRILRSALCEAQLCALSLKQPTSRS